MKKPSGVRTLICLSLLGLGVKAPGQQPPTLESPGVDPLGRLQLVLHGEPGTNYSIEVSRDLNLWLPLTSGTATNGQMGFQYAPGNGTRALYYRARLDLQLAPIHVSVQVDTNNQTLALITPDDGGSLSLIGANGVTYTLTVPPQAVFDSEVLTMTVVTGLGGLPFSSGLLGGVMFTPDDLQFVEPAQLTVQFPTNPPVNSATVAAYAFDADGSYLRLVSDLAGTNSVTLPLAGLSGLGCSVATFAELQQEAHRIVSDTNSISGTSAGTHAPKGLYYDSCYPAEKTRAVFVNKGIENALRPIQQEMAAKIGEARVAMLLGADSPSATDLGLQAQMDGFFKNNLAQYADEIKTNCALGTVISRYAVGIERQSQLATGQSLIPDSFIDFCSVLPECARKIDECCKTKGASQQALEEIIGLTRQAELLGCTLPDWYQNLSDCYPGWSGTIKYEDAYSNFEQLDPDAEADWNYHLTATFEAVNLLGSPTGQGYYGVSGTVSAPVEGNYRQHTRTTGNCCYCYTDTLRNSAIKTNVNALLQLVWAVTNVPPPIQNGLLLFPDISSLASLAAVPAKLTETDSSGDADCNQVLHITTTDRTDAYALGGVQYNSSTIVGTLTNVTGSYVTNWTASDGTQYSRKISWDLRKRNF